MAQVAQNDTQAGNTTKRLRSRGWLLTINNFDENDEKNIINIGANKYIYQEEVGHSGTAHLQVFLYFDNPIDFNSIKKWFPKAHIEKAKNNKDSIKYCSKTDTRVRGPYVFNIELPKPINIITTLKPWQQSIINIIEKEPDDRTINWIYDAEGNKGKTAICKYIIIKYNHSIYVGGAAKDMKYAIYKEKIKPKIVLIDYSRSQEGHISYQGIEEIKNGIYFNTKYESGMVVFPSPHILVFANFLPIKTNLSLDRWNIIDISQEL